MDIDAKTPHYLSLLLSVAFGFGAWCPVILGADAEPELTIGLRHETAAEKPKTEPALIAANLSETATLREAEKIAQRLAKFKTSDSDSAAISGGLQSDRERYGAIFAKLLDPGHFKDATTRKGALHAIQIAAPKSLAIGKSLADCVIAEPVADVRNTAIDMIRHREDHMAGAEVLRYWRASYNEDAGFNETARAAAVAAMRDIGDRQVYEGLLYYATLEVRAEAATNPVVNTVAIRGNRVNLPIDLPSSDGMGFHATLVIPALGSLQQATGEHFGRSIDKWNEWLQKQPDFKK